MYGTISPAPAAGASSRRPSPNSTLLRAVFAVAALLTLATRIIPAGVRAELGFSTFEDVSAVLGFSSTDSPRAFRHAVRARMRVRAGERWAVAVRYAPRSATALPPLWSTVANVSAVRSAAVVEVDFSLARLRPATEYHATLFARRLDGGLRVARDGAPRAAGRLDFATAATGCAAFDNGSLALRTAGVASYEVLLTPWRQDDCVADALAGDQWQGLLGLDAEGFAVFAHAVDTPGPAQQLGGGDLVMLAGGAQMLAQDVILRLAPDGTEVARSGPPDGLWTGPRGCVCASRCVTFSHEAREVAIDGKSYVITELASYSPSPFGAEGVVVDGVRMRPDLLMYENPWVWDGEGDGAEHWTQLVDLAADFAVVPRSRMSEPVAYSNDWLNVTCPGPGASDDDDDPHRSLPTGNGHRSNSTMLVSDVLHTSSVDVRDGVLAVTMREVNAIAAFSLATRELLWLVASPGTVHVDGKSLALAAEDEFYAPHMISWLDAERFMFLDDGTTRRGCSAEFASWVASVDPSDVRENVSEPFTTSACWSRAVVMRVDVAAGEAAIESQFEWPIPDAAYASGSEALSEMAVRDVSNVIGGALWQIPGSAHFLVGFVDTMSGPDLIWEVAFPVSGDVQVYAAMEISGDHGFAGAPGLYRVTPIRSLDGESATSPI